jgi:hypothetical protein
MVWTGLIWLRDRWTDVVYTVMNLRIPQDTEKFLSSCTTSDFAIRTQLHEVSQYICIVCQSVSQSVSQYPFSSRNAAHCNGKLIRTYLQQAHHIPAEMQFGSNVIHDK